MIKAFKSSSSRSNRNSSSNKHEIMVACSCSGVVSSALVEQGIAGGVDRQVVAAAVLVAEGCLKVLASLGRMTMHQNAPESAFQASGLA